MFLGGAWEGRALGLGPVAPRPPEAVGHLVYACTFPAEGARFSEESLKRR